MTTLAQYDRARAALAEATRVDQVLPILDEVEHIKLYAKQIDDQALLADAHEFQMRAERRLGFVIQEAKKAGHFKPHRRKKGSEEEPIPPVTLADVGVDKKLSSRAQGRSSIAEQAFELMVRTARENIASGKAKLVGGAPSAHGAGRVQNAGDLDYSPTPPWATRALVEHVMPHIGVRIEGKVREPACGEGHIAEVLRETCGDVIATDIYDRFGYADHTADYLSADFDVGCDWTVTNPPFEDRVIKFIKRALINSRKGVAMFLQLRYLEGVDRYNEIFKNRPPTVIAPFVERVPLLMGEYDPKASTTTAFMWLVWIKGATPMAPFWVPPGCRKSCARPDDDVRFTAHPVTKGPRTDDGNAIEHDADGEIIEPVSAAPPVEEPPANESRSTGNVAQPLSKPIVDDNLEIPDFLRRYDDKHPAPVTVASPCLAQLVNGEGNS